MFEYNKAKIKVDSHQLLTDVGTVLTENMDITKVRIEGHTDGDGSAKYNKKLSQKRANAVRDFIVKLGIDESRLEAVGYGEDRPVASNDTDEGKEQNRRVEFNILAREKKAGGMGVAKPAEKKAEEKPADDKAEGGE
jgi:OOP family OmpA-OmpF porin